MARDRSQTEQAPAFCLGKSDSGSKQAGRPRTSTWEYGTPPQSSTLTLLQNHLRTREAALLLEVRLSDSVEACSDKHTRVGLRRRTQPRPSPCRGFYSGRGSTGGQWQELRKAVSFRRRWRFSGATSQCDGEASCGAGLREAELCFVGLGMDLAWHWHVVVALSCAMSTTQRWKWLHWGTRALTKCWGITCESGPAGCREDTSGGANSLVPYSRTPAMAHSIAETFTRKRTKKVCAVWV